MKKSFFEKVFPHHTQRIRARHTESECIWYMELANERLNKLTYSLLGIFGCLMTIIFIHFGHGSFKPKTLSGMFLISIYTVYYAIVLFIDLKDIDKETLGEREVAQVWKKASILIASVSLLFSPLAMYECITTIFSDTNYPQETFLDHEYIVEYPDFGIKITIPSGWSDIEWECQAEPYTSNPSSNRFYVWNKEHTMWIYMYGCKFYPETTVSDMESTFSQHSQRYLDGDMAIEKGMMTLHGIDVYRAIGNRKDFPDWIYIEYMFFNNGTEIIYTYRFLKELDRNEEIAKADSMIGNFELHAKPIPGYILKHQENRNTNIIQQDMRPDDFEVSSKEIRIKSADIVFRLPGTLSQVKTRKITRSEYIFDIDMESYLLGCDLTVVYTSVNASLAEHEGGFAKEMANEMDGGFISRPEIRKLAHKSVITATGKRKEATDSVLIKYYILHKGALLKIYAEVPSDYNIKNAKKQMESFIKDIKFL